uniref:Uncharacterized protein n=1 Tax=Anabas testudineus TaxID=64144 RepID=A0A7N6BHM6_ANATE
TDCHYMPCRAGWVGPTVPLCIYGFCSMMRPIDEQVNLVLLVPVLLVTDFLRYKPVIILLGFACLLWVYKHKQPHN